MAIDSRGEHEVPNQKKTTKAEIDKWIDDNEKAIGLDWRVGYQMQFRDSRTLHTWRWSKDDRPALV